MSSGSHEPPVPWAEETRQRDVHAPGEVHLPAPTVWPCAAAAGVTLLAFGLVTTLAFAVAGAALFALALAGWLRELLRE